MHWDHLTTAVLLQIESELRASLQREFTARRTHYAIALRRRWMRMLVERLRGVRFELSLRQAVAEERYHEVP